MTDWRPRITDLKYYPHFDKFIEPEVLWQIASDPKKVAQNAFYPFIQYKKHWRPFRDKPTSKKHKERLIRYASRRDSYIFSYYRHILAEHYEREIERLDIVTCPLAYRQLTTIDGSRRGKCNIDFAYDAFTYITQIGNCVAIALDISSYFDSIDHHRLKQIWCRLLGCDTLPQDHAKVFRAITNYAFVDRDKLYRRLGYINFKEIDGKSTKGYVIPYKKMPLQLCSPSDFREKVCGKSDLFSFLVEKNKLSYGIPQGAPISDLLSNMYLIDFDVTMHQAARNMYGVYYRYSDDILVIIPGDENDGVQFCNFAIAEIQKYGSHLSIKKEKCAIVKFVISKDTQRFVFINGNQGRNGLEYLGFRFDGKNIFLRDSTLSSFYRRITFAARQQARKFVARYPRKDISYLCDKFNYEAFIKQFGRVEDFESHPDYKNWTFWTYARRAAEIMAPRGNPILQQVARHRDIIRCRLIRELQCAAAEAALRKPGEAS